MRALMALVVLSVLGSGCLQDGPLAETPTLSAEAGAVRLVGSQRELPVRSFEPTIGVTSDGTVFMSTMVEADPWSPAYVARSKDEGKTWEDVTPRLGPVTVVPNTNDPFIYVDQDTDRLFTFDLQGTVCQTLSWSDDLGETWITNPLACGVPPGAHDHQMFFTSWPRGPIPVVGYEKVLHYCVNRLVDAACSASHDGGLTWGPLVRVFDVMEACGGPGFVGRGVGGPEGRIYVPSAPCGDPVVYRSEDDGLTWTRHPVSDLAAEDQEFGVAVDEEGTVHVFWPAGRGRAYYTWSEDHGATWQEPVQVAPEGLNVTRFPALAAGASGRAVATYYGTAGNISNSASSEWGREIVWHAYATVIVHGEAGPSSHTAMFDSEEDPIGRGWCGAAACKGLAGVPDRIDPDEQPSVGDFLAVTIGPDGRPWAALVDTCRDTCATEGEPLYSDARGAVGTLREGPALLGPPGPLRSLTA